MTNPGSGGEAANTQTPTSVDWNDLPANPHTLSHTSFHGMSLKRGARKLSDILPNGSELFALQRKRSWERRSWEQLLALDGAPGAVTGLSWACKTAFDNLSRQDDFTSERGTDGSVLAEGEEDYTFSSRLQLTLQDQELIVADIAQSKNSQDDFHESGDLQFGRMAFSNYQLTGLSKQGQGVNPLYNLDSPACSLPESKLPLERGESEFWSVNWIANCQPHTERYLNKVRKWTDIHQALGAHLILTLGT